MNKILIAFISVLLGSCPSILVSSSFPSQSQSRLVEFKFNDEELLEMDKWQDKSASDMCRDAFECDRAALYMLGMSFTTGSIGITIDVEKADLFFSKSASFGFAPSIKQIINKNMECYNLSLVLVYYNLLISLGHQEYVVPYHELRAKFLDSFGPRILTEIERIALEKYNLINSNIEKLKKVEDKQEFFLSMSINKCLIDSQDKDLDSTYWVRFSKFQVKLEEDNSRLQSAINGDLKNLLELYVQSKLDLRLAIDSYRKGEKFRLMPEALKRTVKAMNYADRFKISMESFKDASDKRFGRIAREYLYLSENIKIVLEQHNKFFSSPKDFSDSDVRILLDASLKVEVYSENLKEMIEELKVSNK